MNSVATACYTPSNILNFSYENTPAIHHFHIDHNAPCLPPKILGITVSREIEDTGYGKFVGYTRCNMVYVKTVGEGYLAEHCSTKKNCPCETDSLISCLLPIT